jgi:hypothetical protein
LGIGSVSVSAAAIKHLASVFGKGRLLRPCRERPRRRTAEKRDEVPPFNATAARRSSP